MIAVPLAMQNGRQQAAAVQLVPMMHGRDVTTTKATSLQATFWLPHAAAKDQIRFGHESLDSSRVQIGRVVWSDAPRGPHTGHQQAVDGRRDLGGHAGDARVVGDGDITVASVRVARRDRRVRYARHARCQTRHIHYTARYHR
jgi:hypothetical protein